MDGDHGKGSKGKDVDRLKAWPDKTIIRNRAKLNAVIANARVIRDMEEEEEGSFAEMLFTKFLPESDDERLKVMKSVSGSHMRSMDKVDPKTYITRKKGDGVHPTRTCVLLSNELMGRGMRFCRPTTVLSFMQAMGLVNHHDRSPGVCDAFRRNEAELADLRAWMAKGKRVSKWKRPK